MIKPLLFFMFSILLFSVDIIRSQELSGNISAETRIFPESPLDSKQHGSSLSLSLKPELFFDWSDGYQSLLFVPYLRIDQADDERTHFDIREFYWLYASNSWELRLGIRKVFWGVTESQHLVDVINQTDFVENIDGEQKLGQPMLNVALIQNWGTVDLFLLAGFRERNFPGIEGRLRFPFRIDVDNADYESADKNKHIDWALRWSHTLGNFDVGISHFYGTNREPRFVGDFSKQGPVFRPRYDLINQTGLDLQYILEAWLLKLETIYRENRGRDFVSLVGGFEYTFSNIKNSGIDIGVIAEYLYDERDQEYFAPNPFNDHTFVGTRLAFNDVQSTDILAGAIVNNNTGSAFLNFEASRRLWQSFKLIVEVRAFNKLDKKEFFYGLRKDSYSKMELEWYF